MKKILLTIGTVASIAAPITAVVSCGNKTTQANTKKESIKTGEEKKEVIVLDKKQIVKNFTDELMKDENLVLNPIHADSMEYFINNVIKTWTKVQKNGNNELTFEEGFVFHQWDATSINTVTEKVTPIIANIFDSLGGSGNMAFVIDLLKKQITKETIKEFISEKYISSGLIMLIKKVMDGILKNPVYGPMLSNSEGLTNLIVPLITGMIPFAKDGVKNQDIKMNISSKGTIVWKHGNSQSPASMLSTLMDGIGGSSRKRAAAPASHSTTTAATTRLGIGSLTKIFGDKATYNLVSGLFEYISTTPQIHDLLVSVLDKYADELLIHRDVPGANGADHTIENPIHQRTSYINFERANGAQETEFGFQTSGYINWFGTIEGNNITLRDSKGNILATGTGFEGASQEINITFKADRLPLKDNIVGKGLIDGGIDQATHSISVKELATEFYIKDALMLGSTALGMLLSKMMHYITENEAKNPLTIDFDSKIRTARIVEEGSTSDNRASVALAGLRTIQLKINDQLEAMNVSIEDYYKFKEDLKAAATSKEKAQEFINNTPHGADLYDIMTNDESILLKGITMMIGNPNAMSFGWLPEGYADIYGRIFGLTSTANPGDM